jgi:hypothetical protein
MTSFNDQPWIDAGKASPNIMTPNILERGRRNDWAWELSEGRGMSDQPIYGCTFLRWIADEAHPRGGRWEDGPSELRHTIAGARDYIAEVCEG